MKTDIIKLLDEEELNILKKRNAALARGQWARAIELDANEEFCRDLRKKIRDAEGYPLPGMERQYSANTAAGQGGL